LKQGGESATDTILFGKYQLIRILGRGQSGTVYLAKHLELEVYRAVKQVPKSCSDYQQFKREAMLLKRLRHPGIPIVYDLHEDETFSYLIEEFLEGDSFYDIIRKKGPLNPSSVIRYGIQLCGLVSYLHSAEEVPILYLDLQPRNLLLCHEQVKLLDFDHAETCTVANQQKERYGTPGFCAPEQRQDGELGVYTDVYQVGAVLAYLLTGQEEEGAIGQIAGNLGKIIRRCLRSDVKERYQSVAEIGRELELVRSKTDVSDNQSTALILAFAGTRSGVGVTHLALGVSAYLNQRGYPCLYEEHNSSGDVRSMARWLGKELDSFGIVKLFGLPVKPWYGEAVQMPEHQYRVVVRDYGTDWRSAGEAALQSFRCQSDSLRMTFDVAVVLVTGGKWWQQEQGILVKRKLELLWQECGEREKMMLVFNQSIPGIAGHRWQAEHGSGSESWLKAPFFSNPFRLTQEASMFYEELCRHVPGTDSAETRRGRGLRRFWNSFVENWVKRD